MDRKKFFAGIRSGPFPGKLTAGQVEGITAILDEWDSRKLTDLRLLAYPLATAFLETGMAMQPVIETRQLSEAKNPTVDVAISRLENAWKRGRLKWVKTPYWRKDKNGLSWLGRGLPQVTHYKNYLKAEQKTGIPFTSNPDLMLEPKYAAKVMFDGMLEGWFTGKKLNDYFNKTTTDWRNARRIINSLDRADEIASIAKQFYADLLTA